MGRRQTRTAGTGIGGFALSLGAPLLAAALLLAWGLLPARALTGLPLRVRSVLTNDRLNRADYEQMERGYYEQILDAGRQLGALDQPAKPKPDAQPFDAGPLALVVSDLREYVLKPDLSMIHWGVRWSTNAFGMRDRAYAGPKPPGTVRVGLVGDSIGSGWGVDDDQGFEPRLERTWDARSRASGGPAIEILNCAVPGHAPGQRWEHFRRIGWPLGPDLVIYEATLADPGWDERRLRGLLARGIGWDSPLYRGVLAQAGARPGGDAERYKRALRRYRWEILAGVYRTIVADCRARGVPCVWVLIPRVGKESDPGDRRRLLDLAGRSGFATVIDLSDVYNGLDPQALAILPTDYHPNAGGHELLARRLDEALSAVAEVRRLWTASGSSAGGRP